MILLSTYLSTEKINTIYLLFIVIWYIYIVSAVKAKQALLTKLIESARSDKIER